ncbi:MAG: hypothetical protein K5837_02040 [Candidatus Saccharibacteria bacterium]|nr:hypothetical protein [Candidatus Saccharibacteria bacterium]
MAAITYVITGTTRKKKSIKKAINKALAKGGTGTVFASTDPTHSAIIDTAITDIMEETMAQYNDCCDDPDYYEMSDEKAPDVKTLDAKDQKNVPADNPNPACGEACVDQEPEEEDNGYGYTPLEYVITLTAVQRQFLMDKGVSISQNRLSS